MGARSSAVDNLVACGNLRHTNVATAGGRRVDGGATIHAVSGTAYRVAARTPMDAIAAPAVRRGVVAVTRGPRGSTITRAYAESPLKWLTPVTRSEAAWVFAASYGGGLVGGDHLGIEIDVGEGAAAFFSTQASTKVYRSPAGASTSLAARVGVGGLLVSLPDPVVCFASSNYRQTQTFAIDASAALVALDWMTSGRRGSGERWAFDAYASTTSLRAGGRLVLHDAVRLSATDGDLASRAGRVDVLAVVIVAGERLASDAARIVATVAAMPVERRAHVILSAAPLPGLALPGCVLRIAGEHGEDVRAVLRRLLDFVPGLLGDDPWARKW
jgi:urease accessory protein